MDELIQDLQNWAPAMWAGLKITVWITFAAMSLALLVGLFTALGRLYGPPPLRWALVVYVELLRGIPVILTLFIIFFGLPALGFKLLLRQPEWAGVLGLGIALGAYLSEVFRASILSVEEGQREAALMLGMSPPQAFWRIVLPQALLVAVPPLGNYFVALFKDTALLGFISVTELFRSGIQIVSANFRPLPVYGTLAVIYFVISFLAARGVSWLERRLTYVRPAQDRRAIPDQTEPSLVA